jgi:anion-transporting  ArsA/GET3 family ATPase
MNHRLVIFTGKGGVGKTTLSMAYVKYLESTGKKVLYNCFHQIPDRDMIKSLAVPILDITVEQSAEIYIGRKLNSKTIASWIMHTHFFKSLFQMIPGLGHMILLGHILNELEADQELTIVMDSPASGHALTMFESSSNFKKIFKTGLIVKDIEKMRSFLEDEKFLKTYIVTLPSEMAIQEAKGLKQEIQSIYKNAEIILNNSLKKYLDEHNVKREELPHFLQAKLDFENLVTEETFTLPFIPVNDISKVVSLIRPMLGGLE